MPTCPAFTAHARPCTAFGHIHGYCGRHAPMRATPELLQQFNANQARLRARWERDQAAPAVAPAPGPVPVGIPVERPMCGHIKRSGRPCEAVSRHPDGKCTMHHNLATRAAESLVGRAALAELRARHTRGDTEAQLDAAVALLTPKRQRFWRLGPPIDRDNPFSSVLRTNLVPVPTPAAWNALFLAAAALDPATV